MKICRDIPLAFYWKFDPATLEFSNPPTEVQMQQARSAYGFTDKWIANMSAVPEFQCGRQGGSFSVW